MVPLALSSVRVLLVEFVEFLQVYYLIFVIHVHNLCAFCYVSIIEARVLNYKLENVFR
jgi:hypothetical protein